jgi:hypothetical protein
MNTTISFHPDGTALCLWTEAVPLHELGRLEITRASNIDFNNTDQKWEVIDRKGRVRFVAKSRSACLEWDQKNLQPEYSTGGANHGYLDTVRLIFDSLKS